MMQRNCQSTEFSEAFAGTSLPCAKIFESSSRARRIGQKGGMHKALTENFPTDKVGEQPRTERQRSAEIPEEVPDAL